jgi:SWI/SNF-related matrix-associated actin-dependent regulator 1 of chromatin subfamily A
MPAGYNNYNFKRFEVNTRSKKLEIKFRLKDRNEWNNILGIVKGLTGRAFMSSSKCWTAPDLPHNRETLIKAGFQFQKPPTEKIPEKKPVNIDESLVPYLRPYQLEDLKFAESREGRVLFAEPMGLGKTVIALSYLIIHPEYRPCLIIVTATTKLQWYREFKKWVSKKEYIEILYGKTPRPLRNDVTYIINWDILDSWKEEIIKNNFKIIISDEVQAVGNPKAKRTKAYQKIAKKIPHVLALSGTPFQSGPWQFFTILNILAPQVFSNRWKFYERYCDLKYNGFGSDYKGATNLDELHQLSRHYMIRHEKEKVLKDLPPKIKTVIPLEVKNRAGYDELFSELIRGGVNPRDIERLNDSVFQYKAEEVIKWIEDFLESGEKLVVFAWHRAVVDILFDYFKKIAIRLYGGITGKDRQHSIDQFINNPRKKLFIANLIAGGVGIDGLQGVCNNVATVELYFNPATHWQAEDRLHRMGQASVVNSYYLVMDNSIETDIMEILDTKGEAFMKVMRGESLEETNLLTELIKKYKGRF